MAEKTLSLTENELSVVLQLVSENLNFYMRGGDWSLNEYWARVQASRLKAIQKKIQNARRER